MHAIRRQVRFHRTNGRCEDWPIIYIADASPMGVVSTPPLTTVQFDPHAVADAALAAVRTELGFPAQPPPQPTDIARLIVRSTT